MPLRIVAREGRHSALITNAFLNTTPSRPMRSILGVCSRLFPASDDSSQRMPSPKKKTSFGLDPVIADARASLKNCGLMTAAPDAAAFLRYARRVGCEVVSLIGSARFLLIL